MWTLRLRDGLPMEPQSGLRYRQDGPRTPVCGTRGPRADHQESLRRQTTTVSDRYVTDSLALGCSVSGRDADGEEGRGGSEDEED